MMKANGSKERSYISVPSSSTSRGGSFSPSSSSTDSESFDDNGVAMKKMQIGAGEEEEDDEDVGRFRERIGNDDNVISNDERGSRMDENDHSNQNQNQRHSRTSDGLNLSSSLLLSYSLSSLN